MRHSYTAFCNKYLSGQYYLQVLFCVTITAQSFPLTATDVRPPDLILPSIFMENRTVF